MRGFLFTAAVLFSFNLASYTLLKIRISSVPEGFPIGGTAGFPLAFYEYDMGGYFGIDWFLPAGVVLDYVFALGAATVVGGCCHALSCKIRQGSLSHQAVISAWKALQGQQQ